MDSSSWTVGYACAKRAAVGLAASASAVLLALAPLAPAAPTARAAPPLDIRAGTYNAPSALLAFADAFIAGDSEAAVALLAHGGVARHAVGQLELAPGGVSVIAEAARVRSWVRMVAWPVPLRNRGYAVDPGITTTLQPGGVVLIDRLHLMALHSSDWSDWNAWESDETPAGPVRWLMEADTDDEGRITVLYVGHTAAGLAAARQTPIPAPTASTAPPVAPRAATLDVRVGPDESAYPWAAAAAALGIGAFTVLRRPRRYPLTWSVRS